MYHASILHPAKITMDDTIHKGEKEMFKCVSV